MDIVTFQTFIAAAETGSFARAAQRVHASPSTVTERIAQLEHRLGARLFERDKRGCRLNPAGERFMGPAQQAVRAWDVARHEVSLPERFERSLVFGGQYVLWPDLLGWMADTRAQLPDVSVRATAGASRRLNRDLAEGLLDMVVIYDPIFRSDIAAEKLCEDRLALFTGGDPDHWREDYVPIEWGQTLGPRLAAEIDVVPENGLVLDLGEHSADWLHVQRKAGYLPRRVAAAHAGRAPLREVGEAPQLDYPIYACWRRDIDEALMGEVLPLLRAAFT